MPASARKLLAALLALCLSAPALAAAGKTAPGMCTQAYSVADLPPDGPPNAPVVLTADHVELEKSGLSTLLGSVHLRQGGKEFSSSALDYDDSHRLVKVRVPSLFRTQQIVISSQQADFDLNAQSGAFASTQFTLPARNARGDAEHITVYQSGRAQIEGARYTTCSPGSDAWYIKASEIHLDYDAGVGTARNARLLLDHVPVFYAPWFRFPLDGERHTGLLFPTIGQTSTNGLDIRTPVYLNLAPNYDALFTPRYMSKRGMQYNSDFRYLFARNEGDFKYQYLPDDRTIGESRHLLELTHEGLINNRLAADVRFTDVSDINYFSDLSGAVDASTQPYLERSARLTYQAPTAYNITAMVQNYQTLDPEIVSSQLPYRRLPQIRIDALTPGAFHNTRAGFDGEYDYFVRPGSVDGQRLDLQPYLRYERDDVSWFSGSEVDFRYTGYELSNNSTPVPNTLIRALPLFSANGGLRFDRVTPGGNLQTLEPQLGYVFVPYRNQVNLPVFDSGEPDFDITQLFATNRFYGADRVADANHAVAALTSRLFDPASGQVWLSGTLGQIYRFSAPRVTLPGTALPNQGATDFVASFDYRVTDHWNAGSDLQWSPQDHHFIRSEFGLHYLKDERRLDLAYHYQQGLLQQTDVIASTPIYGPWHGIGRWRYSIQDHQTVDDYAGLEYDTCCWALRTAYRRYIVNTSGLRDSGVYVQLELKGLSRIGTGFEGLMPAAQSLPPQ